MLIRNLQTFKKVIRESAVLFPDNHYLLLHTTKERWCEELKSQITHVDANSYFQLGLVVKHDAVRVDTIIVTTKINEVDEEFFAQLANYIHDRHGDKNSESPLKFLERKWDKAATNYPFLLMATTRLKSEFDDYTILCYLGVAPAFRKKGLMKSITLNFIELLKQDFDDQHSVKAFAIHKATHLLFNPWDKECKNFNERDLQELSCKLLLESNGRIQEQPEKEEPFFIITPLGMKALLQYGILKRDDDKTNQTAKTTETNLSQSPSL